MSTEAGNGNLTYWTSAILITKQVSYKNFYY